MASSRFMVNAANPILLRSSRAMMKSRKTKGRILNRSFRIVLASMDIFGGWVGSHGHLQRESACPNDFIGRLLVIRGAEGLGTLCLEEISVKCLAHLSRSHLSQQTPQG